MKHTMWMINKDHLKAPQLIKYVLVLTSTPCCARSPPAPPSCPCQTASTRWNPQLGFGLFGAGCLLSEALLSHAAQRSSAEGRRGWEERDWEVGLGGGKWRWCSIFLVVSISYEKGPKNQQCVIPWFDPWLCFILSYWPYSLCHSASGFVFFTEQSREALLGHRSAPGGIMSIV